MTTIEDAARKFVAANRERGAAKLARSKARRENRCLGAVNLAPDDFEQTETRHPGDEEAEGFTEFTPSCSSVFPERNWCEHCIAMKPHQARYAKASAMRSGALQRLNRLIPE